MKNVVLGWPIGYSANWCSKSLLMKDLIPFLSSYHCHICISFTLVTHVILVLMVLPNFWNPLLSLILFWRANLALVSECYVPFLWNLKGGENLKIELWNYKIFLRTFFWKSFAKSLYGSCTSPIYKGRFVLAAVRSLVTGTWLNLVLRTWLLTKREIRIFWRISNWESVGYWKSFLYISPP
jgi:hypothetical protein